MTKIIAIGGEPGAGKTSLMHCILDHYNLVPKYKDVKLVPYLQNDLLYVLGKYEDGEIFGGTDKMSMAVQPEAMKFLASLPQNAIVLFEGDRLFTASFLEDCMSKYDTTIIYLKTDKCIREERFKERGSEQNKTWLQGRETKISNILTNFNLMFSIETFDNNNSINRDKIIESIVNIVDNYEG